MTRELRTPVVCAEATVDLANTRRFRKQILPLGEINYKGRKIRFDEPYLRNLVNAFREKAFDQVAYQLADERNSHTNDPERTRGELVDVELTADGLDGIFDLTEAGVQTIKNNPKLGVSARIIENLERADGKRFPAALQHVLGTLDPRITGMKPWQEVALSNEAATEVIDLTSESFAGEEEAMPNEDELVPVMLTAAQRDRLNEILLSNPDGEGQEGTEGQPTQEGTEGQESTETEGQDGTEGEEDGDGEVTDEDVDALASTAAAELSNAVDDVARGQVLELTRQLRQAEVERELDRYRVAGLAPAIIEAARPVLEAEDQVIELSNGETTSTAEAMRDVLNQVVNLATTGHDVVDLAAEHGTLVGSDSVQEARAQALAAWGAEFDN